MADTMIWIILIVSTIGTFLLRCSFLWLDGKVQFSEAAAEWLKLIPTTAIAALIVPALLSPSASGEVSSYIPKLLASTIAMVIMWKTRSATLTLVLGMATLWFIRWQF